MVAVPAATPVTSPVVVPTDTIVVAASASVNVDIFPGHALRVPEIGDGVLFTETENISLQPVGSV